jgi:hypothetical protein
MSSPISLKDAERKVFVTATQDGLWDVFIGFVVLMFAIGPYITSTGLGDFWGSVIFLPFWLIAYLLIRAVRKQIVTPRIGVVKFGQARKTKLSKFHIVAFGVCLIGLILGIRSAVNTYGSGFTYVIPFSLIVIVGFSVAAYFLEFTRLFFYGLLIALSPFVGEWLFVELGATHHGFPITFGTTAGIIILTGVMKFIRLLKSNPIPKDAPLVEEE